jgi:CheY-like chemotaxis protein
MAESRLTVLVVDDDPRVRHMTRRTLERAGFEVVEAVGGREAVETVRRGGARCVDAGGVSGAVPGQS